MRRRISYANVAATVALVFSMTGGALAANHYLITSTKQIKPSVLKKLRGKRGRTGPQGLKGEQGAKGEPGQKGETGAAGKDATIPALAWHPLTLIHGWKEYEAYYGAPMYAKDAQGFVHFRGAIDGSKSTSEEFADLPSGFGSADEGVWLRAASTNGASDPHLVDIEVTAGGEMFAEPGTGATEEFVSLAGVSFFSG